MTAVWLTGVALAGVLLAYMVRPRTPLRRTPSARFLVDLPPAKAPPRARFALRLPRRELSLLPRVVLAGLLVLLALGLVPEVSQQRQHLGLWIVVDTSYSMAARQGGGHRLDLAVAQGRRWAAAYGDAAQGRESACLAVLSIAERLTPVAVVHQGRLPEGAIWDRLQVQPQTGGLGRLLGALRDPTGAAGDCVPTDALVLTDQPRSLSLPEGIRLHWLNVGAPVDNRGIGAVLRRPDLVGRAARGPEILVPISDDRSAGSPRPVRLRVVSPGGQAREIDGGPLSAGQTRVLSVPVPLAGPYQLTLAGEDDWDGDDRVTVTVTSPQGTLVWDSPSVRPWARLLGPTEEGGEGSAAVTSAGPDPLAAPDAQLVAGAVVVGGALEDPRPGWRLVPPDPACGSRFARFTDDPLLDMVDLGRLEALGLPQARLSSGDRADIVLGDRTQGCFLLARLGPGRLASPLWPDPARLPRRARAEVALLLALGLAELRTQAAAPLDQQPLLSDGRASPGRAEAPVAPASPAQGAPEDLSGSGDAVEARAPVPGWLILLALALLALDLGLQFWRLRRPGTAPMTVQQWR